MPVTQRSRGWCFTINNYTDADTVMVRSLVHDSIYIIAGRETGENGTPHIQGYVYFANPRALTSVKKKLPRAHLEAQKGTNAQASEYCKKDGDILLEHGSPPSQGERTDIQEVKELVKAGKGMRDVVESTDSFQAVRMAEKYLTYKERKRTWKTIVYWAYGPTGVGKTTKVATGLLGATDMADDNLYVCAGDSKWWDGYDAHPLVIIDDMRKDFAKFHDMLRLLDCTPWRVEFKGGSRQLQATHMVITAPKSPWEMYDTREDIKQLIRRLDRVVYIPERNTYHVEVINPADGTVGETFICHDVMAIKQTQTHITDHFESLSL